MNQHYTQQSHEVDELSLAAPASQEHEAGAADAAIERLRASRAEYLRTLTEDARNTGARWLREDASYAQLKCVLWLKAGGSVREKLHRAFAESPLDTVAPRLRALSGVPEWSRNWRWYSIFLDGVLAEWNKIAAEVEQD
ncbi:hypothetical protein H0I76_03905 [Limibaculum sp. M0105]|uniref:Uncharacterized protein n=1 Tax=Thermohalobaculum xanthum TaxID=2753746 RepID=A0A8J7M5Z1_9RHOB|nr:hypothetical protein [Thermohalobaculum xanthum]MBK0398325.1 hypothetical protein [Thermohalobaculum xanthum]